MTPSKTLLERKIQAGFYYLVGRIFYVKFMDLSLQAFFLTIEFQTYNSFLSLDFYTSYATLLINEVLSLVKKIVLDECDYAQNIYPRPRVRPLQFSPNHQSTVERLIFHPLLIFSFLVFPLCEVARLYAARMSSCAYCTMTNPAQTMGSLAGTESPPSLKSQY